MDWRRPVEMDDVREGFRLILKRELGETDPFAGLLVNNGVTIEGLIDRLLGSGEFARLHGLRRDRVASQWVRFDKLGDGEVTDWRRPADLNDIREGYRIFLKRDVGADAHTGHLLGNRITIASLIDMLVQSDEFAERRQSQSDGDASRETAAARDDVGRKVNLRSRADRSDIRELYRIILKRDAGSDSHIEQLISNGATIDKLMGNLLKSAEFAKLHAFRQKRSDPQGTYVNDLDFRNPPNFRTTSETPKRILIVGPCMMDGWEPALSALDSAPSTTRVTNNNGSDLMMLTPKEAASYDFLITSIPLRGVYPDWAIWKLKLGDEAGFEQAFEKSLELLTFYLHSTLQYTRDFGITAFLLNFALPQQNLLGRMAPRYSLSNPVYFVERLNQQLAAMVAGMPNVHLVDFDQIVANLGRRWFQDDVVLHMSHGSALGNIRVGADHNRLEKGTNVDALYQPKVADYITATYAEIEGMYRSIRQVDAIKIVIFDLDDTMWRGIAADSDADASAMIEGWPLGIVEAASYLWRRGIVLAVVSKNDEEVATRIWNRLYGAFFPFENFTIRKINWEPKAINIGEVLAAVNLLPGNALFVDDNPVERDAVKRTHPTIRVMDASLESWRRLLLWSPELQTATFTAESGNRTEMLQRQIERETERAVMDRGAFLASLDLSVSIATITEQTDPKYARCFELLNKTNQFNTTGRRWSPAEMTSLLAEGGCILSLAARDRFTDYGIVALALVSGSSVLQVVMSCRVFGMEVERALISAALRRIGAGGATSARGEIVATEKNKLSMDLFELCRFTKVDDRWWEIAIADALPTPSHIRLEELELVGA